MEAKYTWYWDKKAHDRWSKYRAKGLVHFVLVVGVVSFGGSMFIAMGVVPGMARHINPAGGYWLREAIVWALAGLFFGATTWFASEWLYHRQVRREGLQ